MSLSGCLVQCPAALDHDAIVDVELDIGSGKLEVKARVVYSSVDGPALPEETRHLIGLEFIGLPAREEAELRRFLMDELRRHGLPSLAERMGRTGIGPVLDPYTIDRAVDRYRRGKRTLEAVCGEYGVELTSAHQASADALAAVRVALAIAARHPQVAALDPAELHERQIGWYRAWAENFQDFLRRKGDPDAVVDPVWPLRGEPVAVTP